MNKYHFLDTCSKVYPVSGDPGNTQTRVSRVNSDGQLNSYSDIVCFIFKLL